MRYSAMKSRPAVPDDTGKMNQCIGLKRRVAIAIRIRESIKNARHSAWNVIRQIVKSIE
ncbi:hypothetical protein L810_5894 [Burkholderia sp. AU4i]|nr:hypothetical protein L810_5894 [Burkholderia sp. AU4i]